MPQAPSLDCVVPFGPPVPMSALAFSPDGKTLAVGGYQEVLLWDLANAKLAKRIGVGQIGDFVRSVAFRNNGQWLAVAEGTPYGPGAVKVFDVDSGQPALAFQEPKDAVFAVAFSPDGKLLAAGGADNVARVWSVDEKKLVGELKGHSDWVLGVSFSADGKFLVTSSADRTAQVWEVGTWKPVAKLDQMEPVNGAAFGPNAELVAAAVAGPTDRMIRLRRRDNAPVGPRDRHGRARTAGRALGAGRQPDVRPVDRQDRAGLRPQQRRPRGHARRTHRLGLRRGADARTAPRWPPPAPTARSSSGTRARTGSLATLVQVTPRTDEWLIVAAPGYLAASSLGAVQWRAANLTTPPDQIPAVLQNPELVKKAIGGREAPAAGLEVDAFQAVMEQSRTAFPGRHVERSPRERRPGKAVLTTPDPRT